MNSPIGEPHKERTRYGIRINSDGVRVDRNGVPTHKTPLDELRGHYKQGLFNALFAALALFWWVDAFRSGQAQWFPATLFVFQVGVTLIGWQITCDRWQRAKNRYEPAPTPTKNPAP